MKKTYQFMYRFIIDKGKIIGALLDDIFFSKKDFEHNPKLKEEYHRYCQEHDALIKRKGAKHGRHN